MIRKLFKQEKHRARMATGALKVVQQRSMQAFHRVGKAGLVAQRVGFAHQIAQRIVSIGGFCTIRGDDLGRPAQQVVFIAGDLSVAVGKSMSIDKA